MGRSATQRAPMAAAARRAIGSFSRMPCARSCDVRALLGARKRVCLREVVSAAHAARTLMLYDPRLRLARRFAPPSMSEGRRGVERVESRDMRGACHVGSADFRVRDEESGSAAEDHRRALSTL